jgi:hypothetical protein
VAAFLSGWVVGFVSSALRRVEFDVSEEFVFGSQSEGKNKVWGWAGGRGEIVAGAVLDGFVARDTGWIAFASFAGGDLA